MAMVVHQKGMVVFWTPPRKLPEGSVFLHHLHEHPTESCVAVHAAAAVVTQHHTTAVATESLQSFLRTGLSDGHLSAACDSKLLALRELESPLGMAQ